MVVPILVVFFLCEVFFCFWYCCIRGSSSTAHMDDGANLEGEGSATVSGRSNTCWFPCCYLQSNRTTQTTVVHGHSSQTEVEGGGGSATVSGRCNTCWSFCCCLRRNGATQTTVVHGHSSQIEVGGGGGGSATVSRQGCTYLLFSLLLSPK